MNYWFPRFDGLDLLLFRIGGPGLGNLLLTWAKCHIRSETLGGRVIRPTWPQIKVGPILRRERDVRWYGDLFCASEHEVGGSERLRLLGRLPRVTEPPSVQRPAVVEVRGIAGLFSELIGHHRLIDDRLRATVRPSILARTSRRTLPAVAIHVRLGDFAAGPHAPVAGAGPTNTRIPLTWYRDVILQIRGQLGEVQPVLVFSDGSDEELDLLLRLPRVARRKSEDALSDLLEMRSCSALIASGSTYSMWASFLGQMPTVWYPGQMRHCFIADPGAEIEYGGQEAISREFVDRIGHRAALHARAADPSTAEAV